MARLTHLSEKHKGAIEALVKQKKTECRSQKLFESPKLQSAIILILLEMWLHLLVQSQNSHLEFIRFRFEMVILNIFCSPVERFTFSVTFSQTNSIITICRSIFGNTKMLKDLRISLRIKKPDHNELKITLSNMLVFKHVALTEHLLSFIDEFCCRQRAYTKCSGYI